MTTYAKKRLVAALLLIFVVLAGANYGFSWFLPKFAKLISAVSVLAVLIFVVRFAPTRDEFEKHKRWQDGEQR